MTPRTPRAHIEDAEDLAHREARAIAVARATSRLDEACEDVGFGKASAGDVRHHAYRILKEMKEEEGVSLFVRFTMEGATFS